MRTLLTLIVILLLQSGSPVSAFQEQAENKPTVDTSRGDRMIAEYFRAETEKLTTASLADIKSKEDWTARRDEYRRQGYPRVRVRTEIVTGAIGVIVRFIVSEGGRVAVEDVDIEGATQISPDVLADIMQITPGFFGEWFVRETLDTATRPSSTWSGPRTGRAWSRQAARLWRHS